MKAPLPLIGKIKVSLTVVLLLTLAVVYIVSIQSWITVHQTLNKLSNFYIPALDKVSELSLDIANSRTEFYRFIDHYEPSSHIIHRNLELARRKILWISGQSPPDAAEAIARNMLAEIDQIQNMLQKFEGLPLLSLQKASLSNSILEKTTVLSLMSENMRRLLWDFIVYENIESKQRLFRYNAALSISLALVTIFVITGVLLWNRVLRNEVKERMNEVQTQFTELQQTQSALRASEHRFRSFVENANDIIFTLTHEGKFSYISPNWKSLLGHELSEVVGRSFEPFVHPDDFALCRQFLQSVLSGEPKQTGVTYRVLHKLGDWRWHFSTGSGLKDPQGGIHAFLGVARDISDLKRMEEDREHLQNQLLQARKMESIGILAGGVAHDFNNLLQAIGGYVQLLLLDKSDHDPDRTKLHAIEKTVTRAAQLIQQLLLFSRKAGFQPKPININQEVQSAMQILERTIPRMITITYQCDHRLWNVNADPAQIEQVLLNLGANAADAMPNGGHLIVETRNITLDHDLAWRHLDAKPGKYVLLIVTDTGCGMNQETVEHIFEPFFTTKGIGKGTGLGLASAYGVIKAHGGYITCYSQPGHGTTFNVYLPAIESESPAINSDPPQPLPQNGHETILIVDDEPDIREMAQNMIERFGYTPLCAASGEEALVIYQSHQDSIQLVILDIGMPGMGGRSCLAELLRLNPNIRVLIASGYSADHQAQEAIQSGAIGFIGKPYQLSTLMAQIRSALDQ